MGAFVLLRQDRFAAGGPAEGAVLSCLRNQGFDAPLRRDTPDWAVYLFPKLSGWSNAIVENAHGFAACTGTLLVNGKDRLRLLTDLLEFGDAHVPWERLRGTFCILLFRNGTLSLIQDRLGIYKLYRDAGWTIVSSSFLGVATTVDRPHVNPQSIYEYAFQGATYDDRTIFDEVRLLESRRTFRLGSTIEARALTDDLRQGPAWVSRADHLARVHDALRTDFRGIIDAFGDRIDTPLSGGFDSRLILALLREQGATPRIHVYGGPDDPDVTVAKQIAEGERLAIQCVDKNATERSRPDAAIVAENFLRLDGYPPDGIFDNGADVNTRSDRAAQGALALNGGGGEIFRNFFYLRDRSYSVRELMSSFFSQFDPAICGSAFDMRRYFEMMAAAIVRLMGKQQKGSALDVALTSEDVEYVFPCFRCVYWMGRNNSVNNRFGFAATPFIESELIKLALRIPIAEKNYGRFEAALIGRASPALARYTSAYGEAFSHEPSFRRRLKGQIANMRPTWARRFSYRIQHRLMKPDPSSFARKAVASGVVDSLLSEVQPYFKTDAVADELIFNRIATLEYLFEKFNPRH